MKNKTDLIEIYLRSPVKIDEVILAKDTEFEIQVARYTDHPNMPEAAIFSALIEEIIELNIRINQLEGKNE